MSNERAWRTQVKIVGKNIQDDGTANYVVELHSRYNPQMPIRNQPDIFTVGQTVVLTATNNQQGAVYKLESL